MLTRSIVAGCLCFISPSFSSCPLQTLARRSPSSCLVRHTLPHRSNAPRTESRSITPSALFSFGKSKKRNKKKVCNQKKKVCNHKKRKGKKKRLPNLDRFRLEKFEPIRTSCRQTGITFRSELRFQCSFFFRKALEIFYTGHLKKNQKKLLRQCTDAQKFLHSLATLPCIR